MNTKDFAEKVIKATEDAMYHGDCSAFEKIEDPQIIYHMMPADYHRAGFDAHKKEILLTKDAITNLKIEMKYLAGSGEFFLLSLTSTGRFTKELPMRPVPVNKDYTDNYLMVYRVTNNKIVEVWVNGNTVFSD
jgi:hypothetical protein